MAQNFNANGPGADEWLTPPGIIKALGPFDLDPCSPGDRRPWDTAARHYALPDDGLALPWNGRVWLNPPYGRETFRWLERLAGHWCGLALIFARTETVGFHRWVWQEANSVFFFKGRLKFHRVDGTPGQNANAPSCLVSYTDFDTSMLEISGLAGKLVRLKNTTGEL